MSERPRKLLDQVADAIRRRHYSYRTEQTYLQWIKRFILFHQKRHPAGLNTPEIEAFLTDLAKPVGRHTLRHCFATRSTNLRHARIAAGVPRLCRRRAVTLCYLIGTHDLTFSRRLAATITCLTSRLAYATPPDEATGGLPPNGRFQLRRTFLVKNPPGASASADKPSRSGEAAACESVA